MYGGQFGASCTPTIQELCLKSAESLAKMMTVIVIVFEAAGLTVSEKKTETTLLRTSDQEPVPHRSSSRRLARGIERQRSFCIWAALSTQAPILCQRSNDGSDAWACYSRFKRELYDMDGCPVRYEVAHASRGDGNPAVRVRHVGPRQGALR